MCKTGLFMWIMMNPPNWVGRKKLFGLSNTYMSTVGITHHCIFQLHFSWVSGIKWRVKFDSKEQTPPFGHCLIQIEAVCFYLISPLLLYVSLNVIFLLAIVSFQILVSPTPPAKPAISLSSDSFWEKSNLLLRLNHWSKRHLFENLPFSVELSRISLLAITFSQRLERKL